MACGTALTLPSPGGRGFCWAEAVEGELADKAPEEGGEEIADSAEPSGGARIWEPANAVNQAVARVTAARRAEAGFGVSRTACGTALTLPSPGRRGFCWAEAVEGELADEVPEDGSVGDWLRWRRCWRLGELAEAV